jgi:hypothetical protein
MLSGAQGATISDPEAPSTRSEDAQVGDETPRGKEVPILWKDVDQVPVVFTNQFAGAVDGRGDIFLLFGQVVPPILSASSPEELERQMDEIVSVETKPLARFMLTPRLLGELVEVLQRTQAQLVSMSTGGVIG